MTAIKLKWKTHITDRSIKDKRLFEVFDDDCSKLKSVSWVMIPVKS